MNIEERKQLILDNVTRLEKDIEVLRSNISELKQRVPLIKTELDAEKFDLEFDLENGLEIIRLFQKAGVILTEPNEQQIALMQKYKMNPANWVVFSETSKELIVLSKRTSMRKVLKKEIEE